jgi:hypothetical protein
VDRDRFSCGENARPLPELAIEWRHRAFEHEEVQEPFGHLRSLSTVEQLDILRLGTLLGRCIDFAHGSISLHRMISSMNPRRSRCEPHGAIEGFSPRVLRESAQECSCRCVGCPALVSSGVVRHMGRARSLRWTFVIEHSLSIDWVEKIHLAVASTP